MRQPLGSSFIVGKCAGDKESTEVTVAAAPTAAAADTGAGTATRDLVLPADAPSSGSGDAGEGTVLAPLTRMASTLASLWPFGKGEGSSDAVECKLQIKIRPVSLSAGSQLVSDLYNLLPARSCNFCGPVCSTDHLAKFRLAIGSNAP